jgi:archaellum component FlaC
MSDDQTDRFDRIDSAIERIRGEVDEAADDSKELGEKATREVREAIDDLEAKVRNLRDD